MTRNLVLLVANSRLGIVNYNPRNIRAENLGQLERGHYGHCECLKSLLDSSSPPLEGTTHWQEVYKTIKLERQ